MHAHVSRLLLFPPPAGSFQPGESPLFSLFSAQIPCLVSVDFCVSSLKDIRWNGHIYGMTNVLKAGGAIIVIQKPPIFGALHCHPVRLHFALPCYRTNFSAPLLGLLQFQGCLQRTDRGASLFTAVVARSSPLPERPENFSLCVIIHFLHESWERT